MLAEGAPHDPSLFYSGTLEREGERVNGNFTVRLALFSAARGGNELCRVESETTVEHGAFRIDATDCEGAVRENANTWVEVSFTGDDGMERRIEGRSKLGAVPYAIEADRAVTASSCPLPSPRGLMSCRPWMLACVFAGGLPLFGACGAKSSPAQENAAVEVDETPPAAPAPPAPVGPITLRCGDLLTADDLNAAGVDPSSYDPDQTAAPGLGVNCVVGGLAVTLFEGDQYAAMIEGFKTMGSQSGLGAAEGPSVGSAHQWTTMGPMNGLMFQSTNRRYAANLSGSDKAQVERLARTIDARMSKR